MRLNGTWHLFYTALHRAERERVGRNPDPSAAIMDSQTVKTVEESARISGYDAHKCVKGRKRHLLVDTLGLPIAIYVAPADLSDPAGARKLLGGLALVVPRLQRIWADAAYRGKGVGGVVPTAGRRLGAGGGGARARHARLSCPTAPVGGGGDPLTPPHKHFR